MSDGMLGLNHARPADLLAGRGRIGLALGSGAAKGWAHIGVIRALEAMGIRPDVVCGTSMGAIVGAAYAADQLDAFEAWAADLEWHRVVSYLDLTMRGGFIKARRLFEFFEDELAESQIEDLPRAFGSVGTDLATGQEVWMREGPLLPALRATIALPGLITPGRWESRWLVDGGLVNPVPVSLCRALGADFVIAVDLNTTLLDRRLRRNLEQPGAGPDDAAPPAEPSDPDAVELGTEASWLPGVVEGEDARDPTGADASTTPSLGDRLNSAFREIASDLKGRLTSDELSSESMPSLYEVTANSINIMQVRIARSRMAGDPPELLVTPRLLDFGLLDFDRSEEAIAEGNRAVERAWLAQFGPD